MRLMTIFKVLSRFFISIQTPTDNNTSRLPQQQLTDALQPVCNQLYATHPPFRTQKTFSDGSVLPSAFHHSNCCNHPNTQNASRCPHSSPPISPASHIIRYTRSPRSSYGNNLSRTSCDPHSANDFSDADDFLDASLTASPS